MWPGRVAVAGDTAARGGPSPTLPAGLEAQVLP